MKEKKKPGPKNKGDRFKRKGRSFSLLDEENDFLEKRSSEMNMSKSEFVSKLVRFEMLNEKAILSGQEQ